MAKYSYSEALKMEMERNKQSIRGNNGVSVQSGIPASRLDRILFGDEPTNREKRQIVRALPRMKHFDTELASVVASNSEKPVESSRRVVHGTAATMPSASPNTAPKTPTVSPKAPVAPVVKHIVTAPPAEAVSKPRLVIDETRLSPPPMPPAPISPVEIRTTSKSQYTRTETIDPDFAKMLLEANVRNRPISQPHVDALARDMLSGKFRLTHQGLACDSEGRLVDGQHRCTAIVKSGVTVRINVTYNVDPDAFHSIDVGIQPRSVAQIAGLMRGTKSTTVTVAAAKQIWFMLEGNDGVGTRNRKWTESEVFSLLDLFEQDIAWVVEQIHNTPTIKQGAVVAAFAYAAPIDRDKTSEMLATLKSRVGMSATQAALFKAYERIGVANSHEKRMELSFVTLRALMLHLKGETATKLYSQADTDKFNQPVFTYFRTRRRKMGLPV